jgi:hypothetical protein
MVTKALKALSRKSPDRRQLIESIVQLQTGTDRSAGIIADCMLEGELDDALSRITEPYMGIDGPGTLFEQIGPFSTFHAKILAGQALGLFGIKTKSDLMIMKHIRNQFAHSRLPLTFAQKEITDAVLSLDMLSRFEIPVPDATRDKFIKSVHYIGISLVDSARYINTDVRSILP